MSDSTSNAVQGAFNAFRQQVETGLTELGFRPEPDGYPERLYHYTDEHGLNGILRELEPRIWATHYAYMNDTTEMVYAARMMGDAIKRKMPGTLTVAAQLLSLLEDRQSEITRWFDVYVACFCRYRDLLPQWRGYGARGGGYSIGLQFNGLYSTMIGHHYELLPVVYDSGSQAKAWDYLIETFIRAVDATSVFLGMKDISGRLKLVIKAHTGIEIEVSGRPLCGELKNLLISFMADSCRLAMCMKNNVYRSEKEWRLIHLQTRGSAANTKFRSSRGMLVPYKELDLFTQSFGGRPPNFTFKTVTIGPNGHKRLAFRSLKLLLASRNFTGVKVLKSGIPGS